MNGILESSKFVNNFYDKISYQYMCINHINQTFKTSREEKKRRSGREKQECLFGISEERENEAEKIRRFLLARLPETLNNIRENAFRASGVSLLLFQRRVRENSSRAMTPRNTNYNFASFRDRRRFNEDTTSRKQRFNRQKRTCQLTAGKIAFSWTLPRPKTVDPNPVRGFRPVSVCT